MPDDHRHGEFGTQSAPQLTQASSGGECGNMVNCLRRLIGALWLAAVVLIPLSFNLYSRRVFEPEKAFVLRTIAMLLVVLLILLCGERASPLGRLAPRLSLKQPRVFVAIPLVLLGMWTWLAAIVWSISPRLSVQGTYEWRQGAIAFSACLILFASIVWSGQIGRWCSSLVSAIEITSAPIAVYGILQYFQLDPLPWHRVIEGRACSTLGHPNFLASYLVLTAVLSGSLLLASRSWRERVIHGLIFVVDLSCIVLTFSRSGWLGLAVGAGCFVLLQMKWAPRRRRWLVIAIVLVASVGALVLLAYADPGGVFSYSPLEPLHSFLRGKSATTQVRSLTWRGAWELVRERPWQGYGPETFRLAFPGAYPPLLTVYGGLIATGDHAHNEILDLALNVGVVGAGLYTWFLLSAVWVGVRGISRAACRGRRTLLMGLIAAVAGYVAQNQLSFATIAPLTVFWVMLGLTVAMAQTAVAPSAPESNSAEAAEGDPRANAGRAPAWRRSVARLTAAGFVVITLIAVMIPQGRSLQADVHARRAQDAASAGDWAGSVSEYERTLSLSPEEDRYWQDLANSYAALALSDTKDRAERFASAEAAATRAIVLSPLDVAYRSALGTIYYEWGVSGKREKLDVAANEFGEAVGMSPNDPQLWARWGRVLHAQERFVAAVEKYERALQLDPYYVPAYSYLGEAYLALQRIQEARAAFDQIDAIAAELDRMVSKR